MESSLYLPRDFFSFPELSSEFPLTDNSMNLSDSSLLDSTVTHFSSPGTPPKPARRRPRRATEYGPRLLPKIRSRDQAIETSLTRCKSLPSSGYRTGNLQSYSGRHISNPEAAYSPKHLSELFPVSLSPGARLDEPGHAFSTKTGCHQQSSQPEDNRVISYMPCVTDFQAQIFQPIAYNLPYQTSLSRKGGTWYDEIDFTDLIDPFDPVPQSCLMTYLTSLNPAMSVVKDINLQEGILEGNFCWWDTRQIRRWNDFKLSTIEAIPNLIAILRMGIPSFEFANPLKVPMKPGSESELADFYESFYATKLNSALSLSLAQRRLVMRRARGDLSEPTFISSDNDEESTGIPSLRSSCVVGLVKSFDRWNSGMRAGTNPIKVEYLRGLSHLYHHMREKKCRYGFIMTEIEIVVVRNGRDPIPFFGDLEIETIQLATHHTPMMGLDVETTMLFSGDDIQTVTNSKMTALLALWYLHMLAQDDPLGQVSSKRDVDSDCEPTKQIFLPRETWMPEPLIKEKRHSKRIRGWVWPDEPINPKMTRGARRGRKKQNIVSREY